MVPSEPPDAMRFPSGDTATVRTTPSWPTSQWGVSPETGPTRMMPSLLPVTAMVPLGSRAKLTTAAP